MLWRQDTADFSWFARDAMDCFYRVTPVYAADGSKYFACAWSEVAGLRVSCYLYSDAETAKKRMDDIAANALDVPALALAGQAPTLPRPHSNTPGEVG